MPRSHPENEASSGDGAEAGAETPAVTRGRRGPRPGPDAGLERIAEVH